MLLAFAKMMAKSGFKKRQDRTNDKRKEVPTPWGTRTGIEHRTGGPQVFHHFNKAALLMNQRI